MTRTYLVRSVFSLVLSCAVVTVLLLALELRADAQFSDILNQVQRINTDVLRQVQVAADISQQQQVVEQSKEALAAARAAIAGFLNFAKVSGVASLIATTALVVPTAFKITENLNFFQYCSSQSYALVRLAQVPIEPTVDDIAGWEKQLSSLVALISQRPSEQSQESWTDKLIRR